MNVASPAAPTGVRAETRGQIGAELLTRVPGAQPGSVNLGDTSRDGALFVVDRIHGRSN